MEENLLNELENFTSIKYLDNVTNSNSSNCGIDDEQVDASLRPLPMPHALFSFDQGHVTRASTSDQRPTADLGSEMWQSIAGTEGRTRTADRRDQSRVSAAHRCNTSLRVRRSDD